MALATHQTVCHIARITDGNNFKFCEIRCTGLIIHYSLAVTKAVGSAKKSLTELT